MTTAIIIVDHGSKRAESNDMLLQFVEQYRATTKYEIVEPAHMELAAPTIKEAFDSCVEHGAQRIVIMPYFLAPGRHWHIDIPKLAANAAADHVGFDFLITQPIGLHPLMHQIVESRIEQCITHATTNDHQ